MSTNSIPSRRSHRLSQATFIFLFLILSTIIVLNSTPVTARMHLIGGPGIPNLSTDASTIVTESCCEQGTHAHKWTKDGGWIDLGALSGGVNNLSFAQAASNNGKVIVGASTSSKAPYGWEAVRWRNGTMSGIALGVANDVSADGNTIVGQFESGARRGIVWRLGSGAITQPFTLPNNISSVYAAAVSRDGKIIVGAAYDPTVSQYDKYFGFYWSSMDGLHLLPGRPTDISGDGSVIVGFRALSMSDWETVRWQKKKNRSGIYFTETVIKKISGGGSIWLDLKISGNGKMIVLGPEIWTEDDGMQSVEQYVHETLKSATGGLSLTATDISHDGKVIVGGGWLADDTPEPTVYLLLHGLNSSPSTWNKLVKDHFDNDCEIFDILDAYVSSLPKNKRCYRYHFASRLVGGRIWENGDGATYAQLGSELSYAVKAVEKATRPGAVVIVGHSRGGLAARAFLQALASPLNYKVGLLTIGTPHQGSPLGRVKHFMDVLGHRPEKAFSFFRFLWSPSTGALATAHDALGRPDRNSFFSEPIWSLNDTVHHLDSTTDVLGQITSRGLVLGENAAAEYPLVAEIDLLDDIYGISWSGLLPGDFILMRSYVLSNLMPPGVFECDDYDRQDDNHWACNGDGIVPYISQRLSDVPGFEQGTRKSIWEYVLQKVPHTSEPNQTKVIGDMLEIMTNRVGFQRFSLH